VPEALYRQIAEDLRLKIESGALAPRSQLPTEAELMEQYGASRNTIRDAMRWLITRGLVETHAGRGTFVVEKIDPLVTTLSADPETGLGGGEGTAYGNETAAQGREPRSTVPRVEIQQATGAVAAELQLPEGTMVVGRRQRRYVDDTPWSVQTSYYPMSLVDDGAQRLLEAAKIEPGSVRYVTETLGFQQVGYRDRIRVRAPDAEEAALFKLPDDGRVAVFETFRTAFDEHGRPFRLTISVLPTDRNSFVIKAGEIPD
jgi:GntR family transcriptional regulator